MLLGLKLEDIDKRDRVSIWYLITAARIQYAKLWKQKEVPKLEDQILSWMNIIEMDKISRKLKLQNQKGFEKCWAKVKLYVEKSWAVGTYLSF